MEKKPISRSMRRTVKSFVKQCQRNMNYKGSHGVSFWNSLLREAKMSTENKKPTDASLLAAIKGNRKIWAQNLRDNNEKAEWSKKALELTRPFLANAWRKLCNDEGRIMEGVKYE